MDEEEQFVNIDLNDDNICSVCKLETEAGTLSFCHVCFELSIEGVSSTTLLHSKSLRGHRDCFEKCHLIANQKLSRSKVSRSAYEVFLETRQPFLIHFHTLNFGGLWEPNVIK
uniref:Chromosome 21 open reading frame 91 n=1 Tax=Neogobius melanostomus TaxID=47308 RepID=A0A8C6TSH7_9GOBI